MIVCIAFCMAACSETASTTNPVKPVSLEALEQIIHDEGFSGIVAVMASWCPPCKKELPIIEQIFQENQQRAIRFAAVSVDEGGVDAIQPLINNLQITYPVYWVGMPLVQRYRIAGIPTLLVIRNGTLQKSIPGSLPRDAIESIVQSLLAPPNDSTTPQAAHDNRVERARSS